MTVYGLTLAIILMVRIVHGLAQPWRGIIDLGVLAGLAWGLVTTLICARHVFRPRLESGS